MSALAPSPQYPAFKFANPGDKIHGVITRAPEDRQAREYGTNKPKTWPDGNPVIQTKIVLRVLDGTEWAVYAEGRMARAITAAIAANHATDLEVGGELEVRFPQYGTPKTPGGKPPKL